VSHFTTPDMLIEIGFDLSAAGGPFFTFGSSSGTADNPTSLFDNPAVGFGGTLFYDLTDRVTSVTITRGLSRELDRFTTGGASIEFVNQDRAFDPFYASSPYYPDVKPRRPVRISTIVAGSTAVQFTGLIEDWNIAYTVNGDANAAAACTDGFILFGGQQLDTQTTTAELPGERINAILDRHEVGWPATDRDIDPGNQQLQADVIEQGREVLEYLQLVAASEPGLLFMSKENHVVFRDRNTAAAVGTVTFSDAGTAIPYTDIQISYGTELLYNRVTITPLGIEPQTSEAASSQLEYGTQSLDLSGLLIRTGSAGTADAQAIADFLVGKYQDPDLRFESLSVQLAGLGSADQASVLDIELADLIRVEYQPSGIGDRIVKDAQVIGIRHSIAPDRHQVMFMLGSTDTAAFVVAGGTSTSEYPFSILAGDEFVGSPLGL
jgi:hypothetical protein